MRVKELFAFIRERHSIWVNRFVHEKPKPWTDDPILQHYRFCNVYRELDTVTVWLAKHWRTPNAKDPYLWFAYTLARFINWPPTLGHIGYPVPFDKGRIYRQLQRIKADGEKVFTGAYLVRSREGENKMSYVVNTVLPPLWKDRQAISLYVQQPSTTLAGLHEELTKYYGVGSFMAAQVIADIKYVKPLCEAKDWHSFAASGPGSRRGLNRVLNRPKMAPWNEQDWRQQLANLHEKINQQIGRYKMPKLHAQDLQNCLCEFDKYERARTGEGRPRTLFDGGSNGDRS